MAALTNRTLDVFIRTRPYPVITGSVSTYGLSLFVRGRPAPLVGSTAPVGTVVASRHHTPFLAPNWSATLTIPANSAVSSAFVVTPLWRGSVAVPAAMTSVALAFLVSHDGSEYQTLYDSNGTSITITTTPGTTRPLPDDLSMWRYVKLVGNALETGTRTLTLMASTS